MADTVVDMGKNITCRVHDGEVAMIFKTFKQLLNSKGSLLSTSYRRLSPLPAYPNEFWFLVSNVRTTS